MAKDQTEKIKKLMKQPKKIRNIGIAAHIDHGKTTLSDNLLMGAGMLSEEVAGKQLYMDTEEQEQERGITIYSANVSMIHDVEGDSHLINLIDTPGHVDFGGDVTRAMRAVDGAVVVACAVEGVMPQTETVVRQALNERVKPILFINKVDRMIKELQLSPEEMQQKFMSIINEVNSLIDKYAEKELADKFKVKVNDGSVMMGSALRKWAISFPYMKKNNITFKDIIDYCEQDNDEELSKKAPLHRIVLNSVVKHLPDPTIAQQARIPKIWRGDMESEVGKGMKNIDPDGPLAAVVTKVVPDPHAGMVACARLFSGTIKSGQEVRLIGSKKTKRLQQVSLYKGRERVQMDEIPAGNIVGLVGVADAHSGETICEPGKEIQPFESIKHIFEPVVTKSIEPQDPSKLSKLIAFLESTNREDPTLEVEINQDTGEYLVHGLGELHIEAKVERPLKEKDIDVKTSPPIVVYKESARKSGPEIEGKSSNKHNKFYMTVEPLEDEVKKAIQDDKIPSENISKQKDKVQEKALEYGLPKDEAKNIESICNDNIFVDATKGIQYLNEVMEMILESFEDIMKNGPMAGEPCSGLKVKIHDAKLHEDSIHRGPAQVIPAVSFAIKQSFMQADPVLLEPIQTIRIDAPEEEMGNAMSQIQNRRGQVLDTKTERGSVIIKAKLPVAEMFGFEAALKSATGGKGFYSLVDISYTKIPSTLEKATINKIKKRKGEA